MYSKFFTRLFLLIGMIGMFSVPLRAEEVTIGSGTTTNAWLPSHSFYKYSLTQQIYTADEIGGAGTINSIAFYNGGSEKTRTYDVYLVNTEKSSFSGSSDWVSVSSNDLVFSGSVTMTANGWTTISFTSTFDYVGDNLAVVVNDKTGSYSQGMECRVFTPSGDPGVVSLYASKDGYDNYDLSNPGNASGTVTFKNQIILDIEMASVTCAKPKNFTASNIAAHTATLTWTAGAEGQSNWDVYVTTTASDVPDENTLPTYQVTECTKSLSGLTTQTTYYAYVRSACGGDDGNSKWASTSFTTTREALTIDAENSYSQDFETNNDWSFANGTFTNQWCWGSATNNGGEKAMYISKDGGTTYEYAHSALVVYASKLFSFAQGTYTFSFDWNANGESSYDFLRVALVPGDKTFTAGGSLPSGVTASALPSTWIALDGGSKLNQSTDWQNKVAETTLSGTYTMVFLWRNDGSGGNQPPAAIDNISISYMTCPRPTNLTASNVTGRTAVLTWKENGTADNWTLQYATDASFSTNLVEINDEFIVSENNVGYGLTGLNGETKYYVRVKSNCDSSWSDVINFTTTPTCVKPTNVTATNITAYTATIGWSNGEEGQDAWEISYSTSTQSNPENGIVVSASTNPYSLDGLTPETSYYVYVRTDCGSEDGKSAWSSYKYFTTLATCVKPTNLTANNVTSSSATITWTAGEAGQDTWNLQYKKASDSEWQSVTVATNSYDLNDLSAVSTYDVRVQADCGEGDLSQWATSSFSTTCGALELPYTYGFEENLVTTSPYSSSNPFPKCWDRIAYQSGYYGSYTYYPYVFTATMSQPYAHGGNGANTYSGHSLRFYQTSSSTNECAVLPEISSDYNMNRIQIRFWAAVQSSQGNLKIGIMSSSTDANTFVQIEEINVSNTYNDGFQEFTIPFSTYTGNGRYIAFMCGTGSAYAYFLIDDITVEAVPSCLVPDELDASGITENEATLSWTPQGSESAWNIQYKKATDSEWSDPIAVDETTYTLTGLQRATGYEVRVQANCATDDQSDWSNPLSFETECGIWPIDEANALIENFNGETFPPDCWQKVNFGEMGVTNGWLQSFNNPLDNNGAVSSDFKRETWLFLPQMHIDGEAFLSFDHLFGNGDEYIPSSIMISTTPNLDVQGILAEGFIETNFTQIWVANENNLPSTKRNEVVSLSEYDNEDVYIAFRYEGTYNYSGRMWYIDNVEVYVNAAQTTQLAQGWNWWSPTVEVSLEELENALGDNGITIKTQNGKFDNYEDDEWDGNLSALTPGEMYKIQVSNDCGFVLSGKPIFSASITIEQGHNWFGYTGLQPVSIEQALNGFTPTEGDRITSFDGKFTSFEDGEWGGNLSQLQPGQGYVYISQDDASKTIIFTSF